jgi:4-hydroxy-2-oxoheptanedioate aldolase
MIENTILAKNRKGSKALVLGLTWPCAQAVELAARAGFDAINLDGEHGAFAADNVDMIVRVAHGYGLSVTARVPSIDAWQINLWLDRGVQGILGPHIETGAQAQALADACLFPPHGKRSWGGGRGTLYNEDAEIAARHGAQIESRTGYENLDQILAVEGLTYLAGGPHDFAASLGFPGEPGHAERRRLTADVDRRAVLAGKRTADSMTATLSLPEMILKQGRAFVAAHRGDTCAE